MAEVRLDAMLREFSAPTRTRASAENVAGVLAELESRFPRLRLRIRDESGRVRRFVRVYVNGRPIEELDGLATRLAPADEIEILHSIQGG